MIDPISLKKNDILEVGPFGRSVKIIVKSVDMANQKVNTSIGPVPFSNLALCRKKK